MVVMVAMVTVLVITCWEQKKIYDNRIEQVAPVYIENDLIALHIE